MKPVLFAVVAVSLSLGVGCATSGEEFGDEYVNSESSASAAGTIDLWQSSDSQWRFHVMSGNGRIMLASEGYTSRAGAINGVLSVLDNGVDPARYELNQTASGQYNLRLRAVNTQIIAHSEAYASKANAQRAIGACIRAITSYLGSIANQSGAHVEVLETTPGAFQFNVHADNGEVVLTSESYTTREAAYNGAFAVQDAAPRENAFTLHVSAAEEYYFTISAANGEIVGVSELYPSGPAAASGIATVRAVMSELDLL
jgi:uncharacterized protein